MPVIPDKEEKALGLNPKYIDPKDLKRVLRPYQRFIRMYKVSK